jgi:DNA-binding MarR family transcriptional regulator
MLFMKTKSDYKRLKALAVLCGISMSDLASALGVDRATLYRNIKSGAVKAYPTNELEATLAVSSWFFKQVIGSKEGFKIFLTLTGRGIKDRDKHASKIIEANEKWANANIFQRLAKVFSDDPLINEGD